MSQLWLPPEAS